jgi:hypothetical protein
MASQASSEENPRMEFGQISRMSKAEVQQVLTALGMGQDNARLTLPELRQKLMDFKNSNKHNTLDDTMKKLSNMKKGPLYAAVADMGVSLTGHETIAVLLRKARQHLEDLQKTGPEPGEETTRLMWGKHKGSGTYQSVYETDHGYIQWVLDTHAENPTGVGKELKKFAMWILRQEAENPRGFQFPETTFKAPATPTGRASSAPSTPRSGRTAYPRPKATAAPFMARHVPVPREENEEELIGAKTEQNVPQWDEKPETLAAFMAAAKAHMEQKSQPNRPEVFDMASNSSQSLPSTAPASASRAQN